jgi:hypothetical protein
LTIVELLVVVIELGIMTSGALDQSMSPTTGWLTLEAAQRLVNWKIGPELRSRIEELGSKANTGTLTPEEDAEYRAYLDDAGVVSLLQAKARRLYLHVNDR